MATATKTSEQVIEEIKELIANPIDPIISSEDAKSLERSTQYRLSDAIREGSSCTTQEFNWGSGDTACALSAAGLAAAARGLI